MSSLSVVSTLMLVYVNIAFRGRSLLFLFTLATKEAMTIVGLVVSFVALIWLPRMAVEANALLVAAGAMPTDPASAQVADVAVAAAASPPGARSDIHLP